MHLILDDLAATLRFVVRVQFLDQHARHRYAVTRIAQVMDDGPRQLPQQSHLFTAHDGGIWFVGPAEVLVR